MKERDNGSPATQTVQGNERQADLKKARQSLITRSLAGVEPDTSPGDKSDASHVEITTKEMTLKEAAQFLDDELGKPVESSKEPSPRKSKLAENMSNYDKVTARLFDDDKAFFPEKETTLARGDKFKVKAAKVSKKAVSFATSTVVELPVGYAVTKAALLASAGGAHLLTGLPFDKMFSAYDSILSKVDYPEAVFFELWDYGNLDFIGPGMLFWNTFTENPLPTAMIAVVLTKLGGMVTKLAEYSEEKAMVSSASPIRQYEDAIRAQLAYNKGNEDDFTLNSKVESGREYINKLNRALPMKLATIKSPETGGIYQVPLELAHALSVIRMFAEKGNDLAGLENLDVFKNSAACQAIFSNAETIAKSMETRIDDFATFAVSVHHAMKGMEYNIFDLTPQQQAEFLAGEMNAGEKLTWMFRSVTNKENRKQFEPEFVQMAVSSGASAWMEMHQRQVMKTALTDISKKLENVVITRDEKGKRLSMFDERFHTVDLSEMGRATEVIWTIKSAMKEFDEGETPTVYAPLYAQLDELHKEMNHLTTKHLESGKPLSLDDVPELLKKWMSKKGEPEAVWNLLLPELEFEPTVDGLAAAHLMRAVTGKVKAKEGAMPDNAMDAEELTKEVAQTAVYDYAHRRGRR